MHAMYVKRNTFYSLFKNEKEKEERFFYKNKFHFSRLSFFAKTQK